MKTRLGHHPLIFAIALLLVAAVIACAAAPAADALPPDPIEPPEVEVDIPFEAPAGGFYWRVDARFGSRILDPAEPDTPALVNYHYCAPERPDVNCVRTDENGQTTDVVQNKYTYDPTHVHPTTLTAYFDGCPTEGESAHGGTQTTNLYTWEVFNRVTGVVSYTSGATHTCNWSYAFPINVDTGKGEPNTGVRLTIAAPDAPTTPILGSPYEQDAVVRDFLIVSIGDSYGSGEGAPDVAQKFQDGGVADLPIVKRGARWIDKRCHRSAYAAAAQASMKLENADPHSSVTFLSFACSGANISSHTFANENPFDPYSGRDGRDGGSGILEGYIGAEPDDPNYTAWLPDQITQMERAAGTRTIDALLVSAGGNDMGFSRIGSVCVMVQDCPNHEVHKYTEPDPHAPGADTKVTLQERVQNDLAQLPARYDALAAKLDQEALAGRLDATRLYLNEYPDLMANDTGGACYGVLDDVLPIGFVIAASAFVAVLAPFLAFVFPPLVFLPEAEIVAMILSGAVPPFGMLGHETEWARNMLLPVPAGPTVPPPSGLDRMVYDAVERHKNGVIPWKLVEGIAADSHGWGANSGGHGHGYCAEDSWVRNAEDATDIQGKYTIPGMHGQTSGMLHPNNLGQEAIGRRIYDQIKPLLNEGPTQPAEPPIFFTGDTNTTGNTSDNAHGTAVSTSRLGADGWFVGCEPGGAQCVGDSDRAFAQIVSRVAASTFVKGARLTINGTQVTCGNPIGMPAGVTCQSEVMDIGHLQKWSFQFTHDGTYQLDATVTARDGGTQTFHRDVKVDLHDPGYPTVAFSSAVPQTGRFFRAPAVATFDMNQPDNTFAGVRYHIDSGAPVVANAKSQLGTLPRELAQATISTNGHHTISFEAIDASGRVSPTQSFPIDINLTPPSGPVVAWGSNANATLGDGTRTNRYTPVLTSNLPDATAITTRGDFVVAQRADGTLVGWGLNYGQFVATTNPITTPIPVGGFTPGEGPIEIAAGMHHVLALMPDGRVLAWGADDWGQLGDGSAGGSRSTPQVVSGLGVGSGVVHIAAGDNHSLAVTASGQVYTWGSNSQGQLGDGTFTARSTPVAVTLPAGSRAVDVSAGSMYSLALRQDGTGLGWGYNANGMTVPGNNTSYLLAPQVVPGLTDAVEIASGERFNIARRSDGTVVVWGVNDAGQLGTGASYQQPRVVPYVVNATSIAAGARFGMVRRGDGVLMVWGENVYGQAATGSAGTTVPPTAVNLGAGRVAQHVMAAGGTFALALVNDEPSASLQVPASATTGESVTFTAVANDTDGAITTYSWDFGDFTAATGSTATTHHAYAQPGTYEVAVTVFDDDGGQHRATGTITVTEPAPNEAPTARFTGPSAIVPGAPMRFDAATSTDPDGTIANYAWDFGDGTTGTGVTADHTFANTQDSFAVKLTVTDDDGETATTTQVVPVMAAPDNSIVLTIQDSTVSEGDKASGTEGEFRVVASRPVASAVTVTVDHLPGTATLNDDYVLSKKTPTTVKIPAGQSEVVVKWHTKGDHTPELKESFGLRISTTAANVIVADATAYGTINDDDGDTIHLRVVDDIVAEGNNARTNGDGKIRVVADRAAPMDITIDISSLGGDAMLGLDYTTQKRLPASIKLKAGDTEATLAWSAKGDVLPEPDETFGVHVSTATVGAVVDLADATMTITNDD